jgi:hypothetical protein
MKRIARRTLAMAAAVMAAGVVAVPLANAADTQQSAGACPGCGQGPGAGPRRGRMFDVKTVTTVQGDVDSVTTDAGRRGQGVFLTLATGSEKLQVVVGPSFYLDQQPLKLAQGDKIEVKGSRTTRRGQTLIIAQEIRKGDQVLTLRDAEGIPLWSRGRARQ